MENESAKTDPIVNGKAKKKNAKVEVNNKDIRSFFNKSSGPSIITTNKRIIKVIEPYLNDINEENYKLRERKIVNYKHKFEPSDEDNEDSKEDEGDSNLGSELSKNEFDDEEDFEGEKANGSATKILKKRKRSGNIKKKKNKKKRKTSENEEEGFILDESEGSSVISKEENDSDIDYIELRGVKSFHKFKSEAMRDINDAEHEMRKLLKEFYVNEEKIAETKSKYPEHCIPISADIRNFKFEALAEKQYELTGQYFDVIMMDPPWQLSSSQPTRGVAIAYETLNDNIINGIPIKSLQTDGFIFIWTINAKFKVTLDLIKEWGYNYCDQIVWVKQTVNGKIAKGHGYYLQHTKETCLIGVKGNPKYNRNVFTDVIFSKRRGQSQKPEEIYEIVERLIPHGYYLEIFGRRNNLRNYWVTIGNEI